MNPTPLDFREAMLVDRLRLRRMHQQLQDARRDGRPTDRLQARLDQLWRSSRQRRLQRVRQVPPAELVADLPIAERQREIAEAIRDHPVVIVCGETGSGKSTQLPKICLQLGRGVEAMIGHTQPRRLAARTIAHRLGEELGGSRHVGFKVRFTDTVEPSTYVKLMTDGVLLAETQSDRFLESYDTLIIDEAHERSLNIDFLLGYVKRLLPRRPDLRVIVTSATIDVQRFSEHFAVDDRPAPVIEVSGRVYPVELRYRPLVGADDSEEPDLQEGVLQAAQELIREGPGDILVFLPTEREIRETSNFLRARRLEWAGRREVELMPLYARLSSAEQQRVFQAHSGRRIVLATNVAESSLTVPGIRYVIDSGTARLSRYAARSKVQRLPIEPVSQASADQRKGRCGRLGPGVCIRLYAEDDFLARDRYSTPEIRRTNLAAVVLQTQALRLGDVEQFPFLDPPHGEAVRDGYKTLHEIGAMNDRRQLTDIGERLSRLPVDPRVGRIILAGHDEGCLHEVLIIAAALENQDCRDRPLEKAQAADEAHARFAHPESDFLGLLKMWDFVHHLRSEHSHSKFRKALQQNFLSYNRVTEWLDLTRQLRQAAIEGGLRPGPAGAKYEAIHRALLTGLLSNIAFRSGDFEYTAAGGGKFVLWPGSYTFASRPKWVVAAELVETSRRYLRTLARIEPEWLEPLASHLIHSSHTDPHWSRKNGSAMAYQRVNLFGLPIVAGRLVPYGPVDPQASRTLLIEHGLLREELSTSFAFLEHNRELRARLAGLAAKSRRRDLLIEEQAVRDFYDARLPADVFSVQELQRWLKQPEARQGLALRMELSDLLPESERAEDSQAFPDQRPFGEMNLRLQYAYEPGERDDGVTVTVPKDGLRQLDEGQLGWLVPGLVEEKIVALIRSLPKSLRRNFVPAQEVAARVAREIAFGQGDFEAAVAEALSRQCDDKIRAQDFRREALPAHLNMNVRVVDQRGKRLMTSRDLGDIIQKLGVQEGGGVEAIEHAAWRRDGLKTWDWGDLPEQVVVRRGGVDVPAYPAIIEQPEAVDLRLLDSRVAAAAQTRRGLRKLFSLLEDKELKRQTQWLPRLNELLMFGNDLPDAPQWRQQLQLLLAERAFYPDLPGKPSSPPRTAAAFEQRRGEARRAIVAAADDVARLLGPLMENYHRVRLELEQSRQPRFAEATEDVAAQLADLMGQGFLCNTPWTWLSHFPRYLKAIVSRLQKLKAGGGERDQRGRRELAPHLARLRDPQTSASLALDSEWVLFRWMIEELRVSLFAQELGASMKISSKRLQEQWAKVGAAKPHR